MKTYKKEIDNLQKQLKALTFKSNRENNKHVVEHDYADLLKLTYSKCVDNSSEFDYTSVAYSNIFNVKKTTYKDKFVLTWDERKVYVTRYENVTGSISFGQHDRKREYLNNESHAYWTNEGVEKISEVEFNLAWSMERMFSDALNRCV